MCPCFCHSPPSAPSAVLVCNGSRAGVPRQPSSCARSQRAEADGTCSEESRDIPPQVDSPPSSAALARRWKEALGQQPHGMLPRHACSLGALGPRHAARAAQRPRFLQAFSALLLGRVVRRALRLPRSAALVRLPEDAASGRRAALGEKWSLIERS